MDATLAARVVRSEGGGAWKFVVAGVEGKEKGKVLVVMSPG
jgi:hypothetical protein